MGSGASKKAASKGSSNDLTKSAKVPSAAPSRVSTARSTKKTKKSPSPPQQPLERVQHAVSPPKTTKRTQGQKVVQQLHNFKANEDLQQLEKEVQAQQLQQKQQLDREIQHLQQLKEEMQKQHQLEQLQKQQRRQQEQQEQQQEQQQQLLQPAATRGGPKEEEHNSPKQVVLRGLRVALREMEKAVDAASEEPDQRTAFAVLKYEKLPGAGIEDYKSDAKEVVKQQGRHMLAWFEGKEAAWFEHDAHEHIARSEAARLARACVDKLRSISEWSSGYDTTGQAFSQWYLTRWRNKALSVVDSERLRKLQFQCDSRKYKGDVAAAKVAAAEAGAAMREWVGGVDEADKDARVDQDGNTALMRAVLSGDAKAITALLDLGCAVDVRNNNDDTALHLAMQVCAVEAVEALIKRTRKADLDSLNLDGNTAMHLAAEANNYKAAKALVAAGCDLNLKTTTELQPDTGTKTRASTALHVAVANGSAETAKVLINAACFPDVPGFQKITPLMLACCKSRASEMESVVRMLVSRGANVNAEDEHKNTPLLLACMNSLERTAKFLVEKFATIPQRNDEFMTPLMCVCNQTPDTEMELTAQVLCERRANVNAQDEHHDTPLSLACKNGLEKTAAILVQHGADINVSNLDGDTPLTLACASSLEATAALLVESGADVNARTKNRNSPLMLACESGMEATAQLLVESDADINVANLHEGNTPLILACQSAMANTAYLLVERDADIRARNLEGKTALSEATKNELPEVESIVRRRLVTEVKG